MKHPLPRLLYGDAYSLSSGHRFESDEANAFSTYYLTFRKGPSTLKYLAYPNDDRIVVAGIQHMIEKIFASPVTHGEIDETLRFLKNRKVTTKGLRDFEFNVPMWRKIVDVYGGFPPIIIEGVPEGSVVYPNEPVLRVRSTVEGFGPFCVWYEAVIINYLWSATERLTAARHWLEYNRDMIRSIEGNKPEIVNFLASLSLHDFGMRAGMCLEESEHVAYQHLYCFPGTDTFAAAYHAWKAGAPDGTGVSVDALAHRVVQGFVNEADCYNKIYDIAQDGDIISMVADCYSFENAVENYLLPLAKRSKLSGNGKVVVARPDSGDALNQILWLVRLAEREGLVEKKVNGWKYMTTLRIIEGDSMTFDSMKEINSALMKEGFSPAGCLIYGVGGFLRNSIKRDNFSTKFALCAVGKDNRPVIKLSEVPGKQTLPLVKVLRNPDALASGTTIVLPTEPGSDSFVEYYNGTKDLPFGKGMDDNFVTIQERVLKDFDIMPLAGGKISLAVSEVCTCITDTYRKVPDAALSR